MALEKYVTRPMAFWVILYTRYNVAEIRALFPGVQVRENEDGSISVNDGFGSWRTHPGDYIVQGVGDDNSSSPISVYSPQLFDATFQRGEQTS